MEPQAARGGGVAQAKAGSLRPAGCKPRPAPRGSAHGGLSKAGGNRIQVQRPFGSRARGGSGEARHGTARHSPAARRTDGRAPVRAAAAAGPAGRGGFSPGGGPARVGAGGGAGEGRGRSVLEAPPRPAPPCRIAGGTGPWGPRRARPLRSPWVTPPPRPVRARARVSLRTRGLRGGGVPSPPRGSPRLHALMVLGDARGLGPFVLRSPAAKALPRYGGHGGSPEAESRLRHLSGHPCLLLGPDPFCTAGGWSRRASP